MCVMKSGSTYSFWRFLETLNNNSAFLTEWSGAPLGIVDTMVEYYMYMHFMFVDQYEVASVRWRDGAAGF